MRSSNRFTSAFTSEKRKKRKPVTQAEKEATV